MKLYYPDFDRHKNLSDSYDDLKSLYRQPMAIWFGRGPYKKTKNIPNRIHRLLKRAEDKIVTLVLYSIPNRDLGKYSKGGETDSKSYLEFIKEVVVGIGTHKNCLIVLEPDALAHSLKMERKEKKERIKLLKQSLKLLRKTNSKIYIDIGHPEWLKVSEAITLLRQFDKKLYDGFTLNVSNFIDTQVCVDYGDGITKKIGKNYIIDTSRNGLGYSTSLFNPTNIAIGELPTFKSVFENCDGYLWVKPLGESDGKENGSPKAGRFYLEYALKVIENSKKIGTFNFQ